MPEELGSAPYDPPMRLILGSRTLDLTHRAAVMAIVNRTPDSFFDRGARSR
jgi:dihydropteroate synthase